MRMSIAVPILLLIHNSSVDIVEINHFNGGFGTQIILWDYAPAPINDYVVVGCRKIDPKDVTYYKAILTYKYFFESTTQNDPEKEALSKKRMRLRW